MTQEEKARLLWIVREIEELEIYCLNLSNGKEGSERSFFEGQSKGLRSCKELIRTHIEAEKIVSKNLSKLENYSITESLLKNEKH